MKLEKEIQKNKGKITEIKQKYTKRKIYQEKRGINKIFIFPLFLLRKSKIVKAKT